MCAYFACMHYCQSQEEGVRPLGLDLHTVELNPGPLENTERNGSTFDLASQVF